MSSSASATESPGRSVTGSTIIPDSERLTLSTSATWSLDREVAVDDAETARAGKRDREPSLGDRVHRGRDDRDRERDLRREAGDGRDVVREDLGLRRQQQHVVEREAFLAELALERDEPLELELVPRLRHEAPQNEEAQALSGLGSKTPVAGTANGCRS